MTKGVVAERSLRKIHMAKSCGLTGGISKPKPARYRRTHWFADNAALGKRGSRPIWLDNEMARHAPHEGHPGCPPVFSDATILVCLSIKMRFKLPLSWPHNRTRWTGCHARGRAAATMRCLKSFGESIAARDPDRQTAEIHIRDALINRFTALGTAEIVRGPDSG